jgi:hypothetical protein
MDLLTITWNLSRSGMGGILVENPLPTVDGGLGFFKAMGRLTSLRSYSYFNAARRKG